MRLRERESPFEGVQCVRDYAVSRIRMTRAKPRALYRGLVHLRGAARVSFSMCLQPARAFFSFCCPWFFSSQFACQRFSLTVIGFFCIGGRTTRGMLGDRALMHGCGNCSFSLLAYIIGFKFIVKC